MARMSLPSPDSTDGLTAMGTIVARSRIEIICPVSIAREMDAGLPY